MASAAAATSPAVIRPRTPGRCLRMNGAMVRKNAALAAAGRRPPTLEPAPTWITSTLGQYRTR